MPAMRRFTVTQTRSVDVTANSMEDAIRLANAAFVHGQNSSHGIAKDKSPEGVWGNTDSEIKTVEIRAKEKTYKTI